MRHALRDELPALLLSQHGSWVAILPDGVDLHAILEDLKDYTHVSSTEQTQLVQDATSVGPHS